MTIRASLFFSFAFFNACPTTRAELIQLYSGNGLPASQPWISFASDTILSGGTATQSQPGSGVRLQSDLAVSSGYSNYTPFSQLKNAAFPSLNRSNGFELSFSLAIANETHSNNNRAGFSTTLLGSDSRGIELGFWGDQIWAQESNPIFTRGESVSFNTSPPQEYRLRLLNDSYFLFTGTTLLLTGSVRNYTAFGAAPYNLSNFLFLGDNTSSGAADITLGPIAIQSNLTAVPEPTSLLLLFTMTISAVGCRHILRSRACNGRTLITVPRTTT